MSVRTRVKCKGHDGYFLVEPDEKWKFLCKKCYKEYYIPMNRNHSAKEIRDNWDVLFAEYKAKEIESSAHAWRIVGELYRASKDDCICPD